LAEVFLAYREKVFEWCGLDACKYMGIPSLGYDMFLKKTGVEIELITDPEMLDFVSSSIRGGLSYVSTRHLYGTADPTAPGPHIFYIDMNNLYVS
jgi:hypothetical protein